MYSYFFGKNKNSEIGVHLITVQMPPVLPEPVVEKTLNITNNKTDTIVFSVIEQILERSTVGLEKYGNNLDRKELTVLDWIKCAQEEHMDSILYLEKLKQFYEKETKDMRESFALQIPTENDSTVN